MRLGLGRIRPLLAAVVLSATLGLVCGAASAWAIYQRLGPAERIVSVPSGQGTGRAPGAGSTYASIVAGTAPSMVRLVTRQVTATDLLAGSGLATAFVARSDGLVLTTVRAVSGATRLQLAYPDGSLVDASIAGRDTVHGVVALRPASAPRGGTPPALGFEDFDRAAPRPGDLAVAVGMRPLTGITVTAGAISSVSRSLPAELEGGQAVLGALTVDAAGDPGDEGAPLLDGAGRVIGVVTAGGAGAPAGMLALDGRSAAQLASSAGRTRQAAGPDFGLSSELLGAADAAAIRAKPGALVVAVAPGGPADIAGLLTGDIVTAVDGTAVDADHPLDPVRLGLSSGQAVRLTVLRAGSERDVSVTVG